MKQLTKHSLAVSALALAMSACTTLPKAPETVLAEPNVPLDQPFVLVDNVSTVSAPSTEEMPSLAATRWQDYYSDEKLKALIELGLENNKSFEQIKLGIEQAAAAYQIKSIANIPSIGSSASYELSGNTKNSSERYSVGLGMSKYELDFWGKVANEKEAALQDFLATSTSKDSAQISLIANIAKAYANISYAKAGLILARSTAKSREQSLYIAERRFKAGVDSKAPSLQAASLVEEAHVAIMNAETKLIKAENALELLIGSPIPDELSPEPALTNIISAEVFNTGLPSELLYYRPDIAKAEYDLKAAGARINVARAAYFPSISLSSNIGFGSSDLNNLFNSAGFGWNFGPSISLPIFDAGSRRANYEAATLEQKAKLAKYEESIQTAFKEVKDLLADRATLEERLATQYRLQSITQQSYNIAFATFRSGMSDYLSVLEAERGLFNAQQAILSIELERLVSQIELYQILGGGASLEVKQVTNSETQEAAMTAARLATTDEIEALSETAPSDNTSTKPSTSAPTTETVVTEAPTTPQSAPDNTSEGTQGETGNTPTTP